MKALIYSSVGTGVASVLVFIYSLWVGGSIDAIKLTFTFGILAFVQFVIYLVMHDMKEKSLLITSAIATGVASALVCIYMIWAGIDGNSIKLLITLGIVSLVQFGVYLIRHDIQEESSGQKNGTIAN